MDADLSQAERRLVLALPADGSPADAAALGFATAGEALHAAGGPERRGLVTVQQESTTTYRITPEGKRYQAEGLPERRALAALQAAAGSLALADLEEHLDAAEARIAIGWLKKKDWATIEKGVLVAVSGAPGGAKRAAAKAGTAVPGGGATAGGPAQGADEALLSRLGDEPTLVDDDAVATLVERGLAAAHESTTHRIALTAAGKKVQKALAKEGAALTQEVTQVTPELIARWAEMAPGERAGVHLRRFDFDVPVAARHPGKVHPLSQMMARIRDVFWKMGFREISGDYVESAFWNMDALFIPQDHPAREMQDTFYTSEPATLPVAAEDLERGRIVHESGGGTGSTGWGGTWDADVAQRALLRTHTTNTTIRHLAENPKGAHKVFGLGKVFRNETMDATHLPEFYQIEGIVTEPGADFNMLVGLCKVFFGAMGFPEVRFRPAYFPYTEPSMEIEVQWAGKWMELGGCGVFRPEVTQPLGVEHPVLAWGFGLERLAMMRLGLKDIRDLYLPDVQWLREAPLQ